MKAMTKLVLAVLAVGFVLLGIPKVNAATPTDTITVTVTLDTILSVNVDVAGWTIGAALSTTNISALVSATNDGNVTEKFMIKGADGAGGWGLGATAGADQFALGFDISDPYETFVAIDKTGVVLVTPIAKDAVQTFKMQYSMPISSTANAGTAQGFVITVTAELP